MFLLLTGPSPNPERILPTTINGNIYSVFLRDGIVDIANNEEPTEVIIIINIADTAIIRRK